MRVRLRCAGLLMAASGLCGAGTRAAWAETSCGELAKSAAPGMTIVSAAVVSGGTAELPYGPAQTGLPAFCRVQGVLRPTADSVIHFEVWLPETGWNHRYLGTGNGGFAGTIAYGQMAGNLKRGFATAGQDGGHEGEAEDASWAYRHPEKVVDFGSRALHLTTERAEAMVTARYGEAAKKNYYDGCSDGGREALMEAQRFPADFDGILAGAPAYNWTGLLTAGLAVTQVASQPAAFISSLKLPAITRAVLAQCDAADGLKDGIVSDPRACHFDPATIECKAGEDSLTCLTEPQVRALRAIYAGGKTAEGTVLFPGLMPGDEAGGWKGWVVQSSPAPSAYVQGYFRYMVMNDPAWNPMTAKVDESYRMAKERTAQAVDATDVDLTAFLGRGGKLLLYHGWNDPAISPLGTIAYYDGVRAKLGPERTDAGVRLYMVGGMEHCAGGPGPSFFGQLGLPTASGGDPFAAFDGLEHWVEEGKAPGALVATQYREDKSVARTRPVCAYPEEPMWDGKGDPNKAESFRCGMNVKELPGVVRTTK